MAAPAVAHAAPPPFEQQKEVVANFTDTAGRPGVLGPGYLDGRSGLRLGEDHAQARDHQLSWAAIAATAALVRRSRSGRVRAVAGLVAVLVAGVVLAGTGGDKRVELVAADGPRRCSGDGVVCLWEDRAFLLDAYARTGRRMLVGAPPR